MYKKILLLTIFFCNALHGMENNQTPLELEVIRFNGLLKQDLAHASNAIESLTTGWTDSKRCLYASLTGVGLCALACANPKDAGPQLFGMGATIFLGGGALSMAAMRNEMKKREIYIHDETKLNASIKDLTQIISQITHINTTNQLQQAITTTSATKQVNDKNLEIIKTCNINYAATLEILKKFTSEYPTSKICFYTTLTGILLLALAWLGSKNNSAQIAGMGSVLFLGAGTIGIISALNEEQTLKGCIDKKTSTRSPIMEINRS